MKANILKRNSIKYHEDVTKRERIETYKNHKIESVYSQRNKQFLGQVQNL